MGGRRFSLITVFLLVLLLQLSGCSKSTKGRDEIIADLQASDQFTTDTVEICDYIEIKRQTDRSAKTDIVFVNVDAKNDRVFCNRSFKITYVLYNSGWLLEEVEPYEPENWTAKPLCGVSDEMIKKYIMQSKAENGYASLEIVERSTDLENDGTDTVHFQATRTHLYADEKIEFIQTWYFNTRTYYFDEFSPDNVKRVYSPTSSLMDAEWTGKSRNDNSYNASWDSFDLRVISFDGEQITLEITKNDTFTKWWNNLDSPPQMVAQAEITYWGYSDECGMIGVPLYAFSGALYSPGDEKDFGFEDYFFFGLDSPQGKIVKMNSSMAEAIEWRQISSGLTSKEAAIEDAILYAKEAGIEGGYDENVPMRGVWYITFDDERKVIWCLSESGKNRVYSISSFAYSYSYGEPWTWEEDTLMFSVDGVKCEIYWTSSDSFDAQFYEMANNYPCYGTRIRF